MSKNSANQRPNRKYFLGTYFPGTWDTGISTLVLGMMFLLVGQASAQDYPSLEIWGFMDFQLAGDDDWAGGDRFLLGQAEIDVEAEVAPYVSTAVALAFDPDEESFGLGVAVADFHMWGHGNGHRYQNKTIDASGLIVGLFDVPFGIDWQVYPSIDRSLISGPLAVAGTHDGWNDLGVTFYIESGIWNGVFYAVNGFEREGEINGGEYVVTGDGGFGTRVGANPVGTLEFGASAASVSGQEDNQSMVLYGADCQFGLGALSFKGEYISHQVDDGQGADWTNNGYYAQAQYDFECWYLVCRYDHFDGESEALTVEERVCCGAGVAVLPQTQLRGEYQVGVSDEMPDTWALQWAVAF